LTAFSKKARLAVEDWKFFESFSHLGKKRKQMGSIFGLYNEAVDIGELKNKVSRLFSDPVCSPAGRM
jgi:hypothetical protein